MGVLDSFSDYVYDLFRDVKRRNKRRPMQTVEIRVKMDCDGCERKVRRAVSHMRGVRSVDVNRKEHKVTVSGYVDPHKVLKRVRRTGKKLAQFWPFVEYNLVAYPYVAGVYDKKAPTGYVRNVPQTLPSPNAPEEKFAAMFSDENVNACSVM